MVHRSFLGVLPRVLLHSISARPPDGEASTTEAVHFGPSSFKYARTNYPVRRVSGIGVEGVERQGCRDDCMDAGGRATQDAKAESCDGPGTALRSGPLERRWSERTRNAAQRSDGPYVGCVFFFLRFFAQTKKSKAPCKAQPVATRRGKCSGRAHSQNQIKPSTDFQSAKTHSFRNAAAVGI